MSPFVDPEADALAEQAEPKRLQDSPRLAEARSRARFKLAQGVEDQARGALARAVTVEPGRAAQVSEVAEETGLDRGTVNRRLDEARAKARQRKADEARLTGRLGEWIATGDNAEVASDQVERLGRLERWFGDPAAALRAGSSLIQEGSLAYRARMMLRDPEAVEGYAAAVAGRRPSPDTLSAQAVEGAAQTIPLMVELGRGAVTGGVIGAAVAYGMNLIPGLAVLPEEAATVPALTWAGARVGAQVGTWFTGARIYSGLNFAKSVKNLQDQGLPVDYETVAAYADLSGFAEAGLDSASLGVWASSVKKLLPTSAAARALTGMTRTRALGRASRVYGTTLGTESATEAAQRVISETGIGLAEAEAGGRGPVASEVAGAAAEEFRGAVVSFALIAAPGAIGEFHRGAAAAVRAEAQVREVEEAAALVKGLADRSPKHAESAAEALVSQDAPDVLVPAEKFLLLFQTKDGEQAGPDAQADAEEAADRVLGEGGAQQLREALALGADLVVPYHTYISKIAPTDLHAKIADEIRIGGGMSLREAEEWREQAPEQAKAAGEEIDRIVAAADPTAEDVFTEVSRQLSETGKYGASAVQAQAAVWRSFFGRLAEQYEGKTADALFREWNVKIEAGEVEEGQAQDKGKRLGSFRMDPSGVSIRLGPNTDLSTFVHETGHFMLEAVGSLAEREGAPETIRAERGRILEWLGVKEGEAVTTEQHEKFARAFEAYLREGKAPSAELRGAFRLFKLWLTAIYRDLRGLRVELSPEILGIFDRLLAADEATERVERELNYGPISKSREAVGVSEKEWERYQAQVGRASDEARGEVEARAAAGERRERTEWYREERAKVAGEVNARWDAVPGWRALQAIREGRADGFPEPLLVHGKVPKIDAKAVKKLLGRRAEKVNKALLGIVAKVGGVDPALMAGYYGFGDSGSFLAALVGALGRERKVAREVRDEMARRYPGVNERGQLRAAADRAVHRSTARRAQFMSELRFLSRKSGRPALSLDVDLFEQMVRARIGDTTIRNLHPGVVRRAEATAAKEAIEAAASEKWEDAVEAKRRQVQAHVYHGALLEARERAEKARRSLLKAATDEARAKLGLAGGTYLEQADALLERFEFRRVPDRQLDRRESLKAWVENEKAEGRDPVIPEKLIDEAWRTNWRNMTLDELIGLDESVRNIAHLAKLKNELLMGRKRVQFATARQMVLDQFRRAYPWIEQGRPELDPDPSAIQNLRAAFSLLRVETLISDADLKNPNGPLAQMFLLPIKDAQHKQSDLLAEYAVKVAEALRKMPKEIRGRLQERVYVAALKGTVTREWLMTVALNMGNEGNLDVLERGVPYGYGDVWTREALDEAVSNLTPAELDVVQGVWDVLAGLWPQVAALDRRLKGIAPPEVKAVPVTFRLQDGTEKKLAGGYFPIKHAARENMSTETISAQLFEAGYERSMTVTSHTKKRTGAVSPLKLSHGLEIIPRHIDQVIHDLTHREALISAYRLATDPAVVATMRQVWGEAWQKQFPDWIRRIANDRNDLGALARYSAVMRRNVSVSAMGLKATTAFQNIANITNAMEALVSTYGVSAATKNMTKAMTRFLGPGAVGEYHRVRRVAGELRHRTDNLERDIGEALKGATRDFKLSQAKDPRTWRIPPEAFRVAYFGIALTDALVAYPTYVAAEQAALDRGATPEEAVAAGERVVRQALGAGAAADLSAVQRNHEALKWVTMFWSYFNTVGQRFTTLRLDSVRSAHAGRFLRDLPTFLARLLGFMVVPALLAEHLSNRWPDEDDDEGYAAWALRKLIAYPFMTIPVVRDVAGALDFGTTPKIGPLGRVLDETVKSGRSIKRYAEDEEEGKDLTLRLLSTSGPLLGLPTGQARISTEAVWDWMDGEDQPEDFMDGVKDFLFRRPEDEK